MIKGDESFHHGSIIDIACISGFKLNFESPENNYNSTAQCVRGFWKPKEPECILSPCLVPNLSNGNYYHHHLRLKKGNQVSHSESVNVQCDPGFVSTGSPTSKCWFGNWTFTSSEPQCSPAPCTLPDLNHGLYSVGYRSGLIISHGSFIQYECSKGYTKGSEVIPRCIQGKLKPEPPHCFSLDVFNPPNDGDSSLPWDENANEKYRPRLHDGLPTEDCQDLNTTNAYDRNQGEDDGEKSEEAENVRNQKKIEDMELLVNKSCSFFPPTASNILAFYGDTVLDSPMEFDPGTELTYRCSDIGKYQLVGSSKRTCSYGSWTGMEVTCYGRSQEHDYARKLLPLANYYSTH